jgi:cob(I)alamin adenosyltransferase
LLGKGYVQLYTGNGKGKTTAALGLALRAAGNGLSVLFLQFMKGADDYGEIAGLALLGAKVRHVQTGRDVLIRKGEATEEDMRLAREGWARAERAIREKEADLVVLDEINCAVDFGLLPAGPVLAALASKPDGVEVVLTGRNAPGAFVEAADLVTEMREVKHYYAKGVSARAGIER